MGISWSEREARRPTRTRLLMVAWKCSSGKMLDLKSSGKMAKQSRRSRPRRALPDRPRRSLKGEVVGVKRRDVAVFMAAGASLLFCLFNGRFCDVRTGLISFKYTRGDDNSNYVRARRALKGRDFL